MKISAAIALAGLAVLGSNHVVTAANCAPNCSDVYKPLCASDGNTYTNQCFFDYQKCSKNDTSLTVVSQGECGSFRVSVGGCERGCIDVYKPVCGSDGTTYKNECELNNAKCGNPNLTKASDGECVSVPECDINICTPFGPPKRICGSDGNVYSSMCLFQNAQCENPSLTMVACPKSSS